MTRLQKKKRIRKKEEEEERNVAVSSGERASWNCRLGLHGPRLIGRRRLTPGRPVLMPIRHGLYSRTDRFLPLSPLERRLVSPTSSLFCSFSLLTREIGWIIRGYSADTDSVEIVTEMLVRKQEKEGEEKMGEREEDLPEFRGKGREGGVIRRIPWWD